MQVEVHLIRADVVTVEAEDVENIDGTLILTKGYRRIAEFAPGAWEYFLLPSEVFASA